jgi:amidohydrolase
MALDPMKRLMPFGLPRKSLQQNPLRPVVLTFAKIQGGRAPNVIADQVQLQGTVRSLHPETREKLPHWIETIVKHVCESYGATYHMTYHHGVPSVHNNPALTQLLESSARALFGSEGILVIAEPSLGAEDFSLYLDQVPGAMFRLGVGYRDRTNAPLHHPQFEVDEQAITTGVATLAYAAYQYWFNAPSAKRL